MKKSWQAVAAALGCAFAVAGCGGGSPADDSEPPQAPWTVHEGSSRVDLFAAVAVDPSGNVYAAGESEGTLFGHTPKGLSDAVIVKYDPTGNVQWSASLGTALDESADAVAVDKSGNVYVGGSTTGDLGGSPGNTSLDAYVAKFSSSGELLWLRQIHTAGLDSLRGLTIDASGDVVIAGTTDGNLFGAFGGGDGELFIAKLDASGNLAWGYQDGTGILAEAMAVTTDSSGNVFATGHVKGGLDGNPDKGGVESFVTKLSPVGIRQWTRQYGGADSVFATGIVLDGDGNMFLSGWTPDSLDGQQNAGQSDAFVMRLHSSGQRQWTRLVGSSGDDFGTAIALDASGNLIVTGYTDGALPGFANAGSSDALAFKLDAQGSLVWTRQWGSSEEDMAWKLASDASGSVYVAGWSWGVIDDIPNSGLSDAFLFKFDSAGKAR